MARPLLCFLFLLAICLFSLLEKHPVSSALFSFLFFYFPAWRSPSSSLRCLPPPALRSKLDSSVYLFFAGGGGGGHLLLVVAEGDLGGKVTLHSFISNTAATRDALALAAQRVEFTLIPGASGSRLESNSLAAAGIFPRIEGIGVFTCSTPVCVRMCVCVRGQLSHAYN